MAEKLILKGKAFVCDLSAEEIREYRGTLLQPGKESPYRNRSIEENLTLFREMRAGKYKDGEKVLRAKIDMASPNINMRDPVIYRILRATHHRTGDKWLIYPMYDFTHPICDALEGITHSICTLEFEDHRPLYDWVTENCEFERRPRQIEFARLNITNTVMSKRYLKKLVDEGAVDGWDDPRMPTLSGLRNRGVPAEALKDFCDRIGVCKANSQVEIAYLEACIRENLNENAERAMAVTNPIKVVIENYEGEEELDFEIKPNCEDKRKVTFTKEIYIDGSDFMLNPPPKYFRLVKGGYVRLKNAYIIKCEDVILDGDKIVELKCSYVPESKSGQDTSGIKVKGVIQWVSAKYGVKSILRKYDYLLKDEEYSGQDFSERLNLDSKKDEVCFAEPYLKEKSNGEVFQLVRIGYFKSCIDKKGEFVLQEVVSLKDNFNKIAKK